MIPPTDAVLNRISQEFLYEDLVVATGSFSASSRLGEGSYGAVFHGVLRDGTEVAIKALASPKEGGFREEVEVLSRFRHPNLVTLMGFARNGRERYLVYELLPGGDVNSRLNKDLSFTWKPRLDVVLDAALGLSHLHCSRPQVFHRDVKTQNILMDKNGTGKVADFGLACLAQPNQDKMAVAETSGTIGYADPLYIRTGVVTEKSEVYSLGMVILEVLTGRPPALQHPSGRIEYQFDHLNGELKRLLPMLDPRGKWPDPLAQRLGALALQCTCEHEAYRPSFVDIVKQLRAWLRDDSLQQTPAAPEVAPTGPQAPPGAQQHRQQQQQQQHPQPHPQQQQQQQQQQQHQQYQQQQQQTPWPQQAGGHHRDAAQMHPAHAAAYAQGGGHHARHGETGARAQQAFQRLDRRPTQHQDQPQQQRSAYPAPVQRPEHAEQHAGHHAPQQNGNPQSGHHGGQPGANANQQWQNQARGTQREPQSSGRQEEVIRQLVEMGYTREQSIEAAKRCSSVEASIEWLLTNVS